MISPKSANPCFNPSDCVAEIPIPKMNEIINAVVTSKNWSHFKLDKWF